MTSIQGEALRDLFQRLPEAVKLINREGRIQVINPAGLRLLEAGSGEELLGQALVERVSAPQRPAFQDWLARAWAGSADPHEFPLTGLRGTERWLEARAAPLSDAHGEVTGLLVVSRDLTARRRLEEQLRLSRERLLATLHSIGDAVIATDEHGRVEELNPVAERLTGWPAGEARGRPLTEVFPIVNEETRQPVEDPVTRVWREGTVVGLANHTLLLARDGREIPIADAGAPIRDAAGRIRGVVLVFRDQTAERAAQRAVAEARAFAESIVATMREPLLVLDAGLRVVSANRAFYRTFQVTPEETLGRPLHELGNREWDIPELRRLLEDLLPQNTQFQDFEVTHEFERIGRRTLLLNARRLYREGGRTEMILLAFEDITERKRAEEALQEVRERDRNIYELISDYAYTFRVEPDGTLRGEWVNETFVRVFGYTIPEIEARGGWPSMVHPEDLPAMLAHAQRVAGGRRDVWETRFVTRSGEVRWIRDHAVPIHDPATGRVVRIHGAAQDITERKRAEQERDRLAVAIEQAAEAIIITDPAARILYVNPAFERITGYTVGEVLGQNPRLLKSGRHDAAFYARLWATLTAGAVWRGRLINRKKDGTLYEEEKSIAPVRDAAGRLLYYVAVGRDVTRERELEAQLLQAQKLEAIGRLAGGVAHDFNNILAVLLLQAELLGRVPNLPDQVREGLEQMRHATERAASLTRQLLLFSRKQALQPRHLDLNQVVNGMARMLRRLIGEDIHFELQTAAEPLPLHADPGMIEQVLLNLVVNARDAMPRGGRLRVRTGAEEVDEDTARRHPEARPGRYVWLRVEDTGCGIPPEVLPHIFEPFFTTKEAGKGTGLGLATVYSVARQHQGWVTVDTEVGRGSTFLVYLPAASQAAAAGATGGSGPGGSAPGGTETILLVEDDPTLRESTRAVLAARGYEVLVAEDALHALQLWVTHGSRVALVLTDLVMPGGIGGQELARLLLWERPGLKVVYTSGYSEEWSGAELRLGPGERFVPKPCPPEQLLEILRQCLDA